MGIRPENQLVSVPAVAALLDSRPAALTGWYATPLSVRQAGLLYLQAQQAIQAQLRAGASCFQQKLLLQWCCDTPGEKLQAGYHELLRAAGDRRERALLELVYGQWLASRKLLPAMHHLEQGLQLAAPLLASTDYFRLLRRHERLAGLAFSAAPCVPRGLPQLLKEAAVISRLRQGERRPVRYTHRDTVG